MIESQDLSRPALRHELRQARRALSPPQQRLTARALYRQLAQHPLFRRARHIALYLPNDGEINPRSLLRVAQKRGKATYLPVLAPWPRTRMVFQRVSSGEHWTRNRFRISEPLADAGRQRKAWALDPVLLPLVGFDEQGGRLGMNGGFYDRSPAYLARRKNGHKPTPIGLAHECQKVDRLALASWDIPLAGTVTDMGQCVTGRRQEGGRTLSTAFHAIPGEFYDCCVTWAGVLTYRSQRLWV